MEWELNDGKFSDRNDFEDQGDQEGGRIGETTNKLEATEDQDNPIFESNNIIGTDEDDGGDEGPVQSALSNPLVLRQIFVCLPTKQLIKVCSLVNKNWNIQARTFVRDHRKYEVTVYSEGAERICTACSTLEKLAHCVSGMNIIPINSICYTITTKSDQQDNCRISDSAALLGVLLPECCVKILLTSRLTFSGISPLLDELLKNWDPHLPKLETLFICSPFPGDDLKYKNFYRRIIQNAPNLKTVVPGRILPWIAYCILPDPKYYRLLDRLVLFNNSVGIERVNLQVAKGNPALKILLLVYHRRDCTFYKSFCSVLQQLLHSSKDSLEMLDLVFEDKIEGIFRSLDWPTLTKLKQLRFRALGSSKSLLRTIMISVDFGRIFPALQSVSLRGNDDFEDDDPEEESREGDRMPREFACRTVSKLEVELSMGILSFSQLKATFPATVHLSLTRMEPNNLPSFWQIFRLLPKLEKLELRGRAIGLCPNHDAEFCGISRDEMRTYYGKDEEFLKAVHIVPIRPCISTLSNLRNLSIVSRWSRREGRASAGISDPQWMFLSKATYLLVFERLPRLTPDVKFDDLVRSEDAEAGNGGDGNHGDEDAWCIAKWFTTLWDEL